MAWLAWRRSRPTSGLNSFCRSSEAWQACMQLLEPSERPEVCFFCANTLLSKVRTDWHKLSAEQQTQIGAAISNKFQMFVNQVQAKLALQRLGLLLAAVASLSGPQACAMFAGQCVGMISGGGGGQHHVSEAGNRIILS
ncbi:hypothetical protein COO60DRAFT_549485 [Scenedesmus sp. NREL 46B-D3]|nr:hypothetical protein COO60DRAFT_549485 [Scenedesmus sp. NREL 46B-D3]